MEAMAVLTILMWVLCSCEGLFTDMKQASQLS